MFKPILFNTEMVKAIQVGRKTQTRRILKTRHGGKLEMHDDPGGVSRLFEKHGSICYGLIPPFNPGDILWVRETWCDPEPDNYMVPVFYKADMPMCWDAEDTAHGEAVCITEDEFKWRPSIHMPKEAARIFLRVKSVRIERLQDITDAGAYSEGVPEIGDYPINPVYCPRCKGEGLIGGHTGGGYVEVDCPDCRTDVQRFSHLWDSTIKPGDCDKYGWNANPWVWVIEFERIEKPEDWV